MSIFGIQVVWLAARVSAVALLARLFVAWTHKQAGRSNVFVLATTLALLGGLAAAAFVPFPDRFRPTVIDAVLSDLDDGLNPGREMAKQVWAMENAEVYGMQLGPTLLWIQNFSSKTPTLPAWRSLWTILALVYGGGVVVYTVRLLVGCLALRGLCRRSRPLADAELLSHVRELHLVLNCRQLVELRECDEPGLAATIGWRRPTIFLPPEWRSWSTAELRTVLAHELAHVRYGDYLIGLLGRLCQVLYFYHPLVGSLTRHLRWHQEVAADALAAQAMGSRVKYLKSLARLALTTPARTPAGAMAWSELTGPTLLRRIQMLHGTEERPSLHWIAHLGILVLIAGTAVAVAMVGSVTTSAAAPVAPEPYELGYLPANATGFVACRPAEWLKQPGMEKASAMLDQGFAALKQLGISWPSELRPEHIHQFVGDLSFSSQGNGKPGSRALSIGASTMLIRMDRQIDWLACAKALHAEMKRFLSQHNVFDKPFEDIQRIERDGITIYRLGIVPILGPQPIYMYIPDQQSVVLSVQTPGKGPDGFLNLLRAVSTNRRRAWGSGLKHEAPFMAVLDNHDGHFTKLYEQDLDAKDLRILDAMAFLTLAVELGDRKPVTFALESKRAAAVPQLREAFDGYALLALTELHDKTSDMDLQKMARIMVKLATELLQSRRVSAHGAYIEWQAFSDVRVGDWVDALSSSEHGNARAIDANARK